jgi:serine/threonine-protein kinase
MIGPYRLIREIGAGGMGAVWLAERHDGALKRPVALKFLRAFDPQEALAERLHRERDILAGLAHPNIARLYDAGVSATGAPYLALEYIEGEHIDQYCRTRGLDIRARVALVLQVARAVAYAHGKLVVHRDLKPANVLVSADGQPHLLDFGIAKLLQDGQAIETQLTQMSGKALTPEYASP